MKKQFELEKEIYDEEDETKLILSFFQLFK